MKIINKVYNIDNKLNKNIVLISDIHYYDKSDLNRLNYVLKEIKKIKPDYICIPGDITDKAIIEDEKDFINWLKRLTKITKVIISLGNHEFYIDKPKNIFGLNEDLIKKISNIDNLYLLNNENIIIDNINFMGITIPMEYYKETYKGNDFYKHLDKLKTYKKYYNVLLCHNPLNICNEKLLENKNIDLILCGHMHGGVMPRFLRKIFKNRGLVSPNKRLFPKNVYGHLKINKIDLIISSGLRVVPYKYIRDLFSLEIVNIKI